MEIIKFSAETSSMWTFDTEYNLALIKQIEKTMNAKLYAKEIIIKEDVESELGMLKSFEFEYASESTLKTYKQPDSLLAWVKQAHDYIELKCLPQSDGSILIYMNCKRYPIIYES